MAAARYPGGGPVDRTAPPPPREIRAFRFPPFLRSRLSNGLDVVAAHLPGPPLVSLEIVSPAGAQYDAEKTAGAAILTASVLDEGTARRSALEIAAIAERLGGYFATGADWDVGYLATGLLASHWREGLELLADVALVSGSPRSCGAPRTPGPWPTTASSSRSTAAPSMPTRSTARRGASPGSTATICCPSFATTTASPARP
jgi:hypothetical protein